MKLFVVLPLSVILLVVVYEASGLSCFCDRTKCQEPKCSPLDQVLEAPCRCCKTCGAETGQNCSAVDTPCKSHLWCIKKDEYVLEARQFIPWPDTFKGTCGMLYTIP